MNLSPRIMIFFLFQYYIKLLFSDINRATCDGRINFYFQNKVFEQKYMQYNADM